jgi:predicted amidohydrolase
MLKGCEILCLPSNLVLPFAQRVMVARSIENRIFTVLANRIGTETVSTQNQITFTGRSQITTPRGDVVARGTTTRTGLVIAGIQPQEAQDKHLTKYNHIIADRRVELYQQLCNLKSETK